MKCRGDLHRRIHKFLEGAQKPGGRQVKMRNYIGGTLIAVGTFALIAMSAGPTQAQAAQSSTPAAGAQGAAKAPAYTMPEYNAFQGCNGETDPNQQVKCLDDFVSRYPNSTLMMYAYQLYYQAYGKLKNTSKEIEYADKLIATDSADVGVRLQAALARLTAFAASYDPKTNDTAALTKDRDLALLGPKLLAQLPRNPKVSDADWQASLKQITNIFDNQAGYADLLLKDYPSAITAYKDAITSKPDDATATYQLGTAYLAMNPPQTLDGFWAIARAIDLKVPQADKVKDYVRSKLLAYEQPGCDNQVDGQLNEMLQLAQNSPDRPATFTIPSADDLSKIRSSSTILTIVGDLSAGGDKAKMTWLATCGSELSSVGGKIIDIQNGDGVVDFMVNTGASSEEMQAATTANMDVKVYTSAPATPPPAVTAGAQPAQITPQPDVARFQKDDPIVFSGTIVSYDPSPFLLHWDEVKVDPTSIPAEKGAGRKTAPKAATKKE
jgi:tetratricopeptide (TPR) repeat protein